MTSYFRTLIVAAALCAGACSAGETPAKAAAQPAQPAKPGAQPAPVAAATAPAGTHYKNSTGGTLTFTFMQADAANTGTFKKFSTDLTWDEKNPAAGRLEVTVQVASLETQDQERDDALKSDDLLSIAKFPTANYSASINSVGGNPVAVGKLTLRGVTRELRIPLQISKTAAGVTLSGETTLKRLDFGVGQGEWKSTEWVADAVKLQFKVPLTPGG